MYSRCWAETCSFIGVLISAGVTQLTRMPSVATSFATDLVSPMTPAFEAEYGAALGLPSFPAMLARFTMRP